MMLPILYRCRPNRTTALQHIYRMDPRRLVAVGINQSLTGCRGMSGYYHGRSSQHYTGKPFDKILIANRGEIACRVIKTARRLGVQTVAVFSDVDAGSMHVRMADEAYCIGSAASSDSYLCIDRIIEVARRSGAQAIHPGYGFLSENPSFADRVEAAGLAFIGPSSAPMRALGDKLSSKRIAREAGCFIIPGYEGEVKDAEYAVALAREVGFPVMLKASAGGGGKGMRVAFNDDEVREGFLLSQAEARSSFGDDRMLIERFIEDPHHIEIQVMADTHGNVVAFPERECSVQRRNQKVVEESPSCLLSMATRAAMQTQAVQLCRAVGYRSAGTIEMLADHQQNFYFLEMNTRLQVEHPITELVTGEDLVEHMLYVAAGRSLPPYLTSQPLLTAVGHAFESRVYAEDPLRGFLPSIGPLLTYREPIQIASKEATVRIDTGVFEGGSISMHYDPMIAKLCAHAPTREAAVAVMENALDQYVVQGLGNNLTFLRSVFRNPVFRSGTYSTKFIPQQYPEGFHGVSLQAEEILDLVALAAAMHSARLDRSKPSRSEALSGASSDDADKDRESRRLLSTMLKTRLSTDDGPIDEDDDEDDDELEGVEEEMVVVLPAAHDRTASAAYLVQLMLRDTMQVTITAWSQESRVVPSPGAPASSVRVLRDLQWHSDKPLGFATFATSDGSDEDDEEVRPVQFLGRSPLGYVLRYLGSEQEVYVRSVDEHMLSRHMLPPVVKDASKALVSPMPGTLVSCTAFVGQVVELGQQLAVVEAMKMQNVLRAQKKGVVKAVLKTAGSHLKVDDVIVEFE